MKKQSVFAVFAIALILAVASCSLADVPQLISFQGKLYDNAGNPLTGTYEITFRIYAIDEGGTAVWTETDSVSCEEGLYNIILGLTNLINLDFDGQYWLGVQVTGDDELSPRYQLVSVPGAFRAAVADSAHRVSWTNLTDMPAGFADGIDNVDGVAECGWVDDGTVVRLETDTDNVGIGTNSPNAKLHVERPATGDVILAKRTDTGQELKLWFHQPTGKAAIQATGGPNDLALNADGGNVGIGTTSPESKLHIRGDSDGGIVDALMLQNSGGSGNSGVRMSYKIDGVIIGQIDNIFYPPGNADLIFSTWDNSLGFSEKLRITGTGEVGIGTTSPESELHIRGDADGGIVDALMLQNSGGSGNSGVRMSFKINGVISGQIDNIFYPAGNADLIFSTWDNSLGFSEKLRITGTGEVGIGITTPEGKLHVEGNSSNSILRAVNRGTGNGIYGLADYSNSAGVYGHSTASYGYGVYALATDSNGKGVLGYAQGSSGRGMYGKAEGSSGYGGYFESGNYRGLYAQGGGGNEAAYFDGDITVTEDVMTLGNIGIGASNPDRNLDIRHSNSGGGIEIDRTATTIWSGIVYENNGTENWFVGLQANSDDLIFKSDGVNYVVIEDGTGDIGIGRDNPTYPLHMGSGARCTAGGVWTDASSMKYKENVAELSLEKAIEVVEGLNPVTFNYKVDRDETYVGFIAEDVPDLVATQDREGLSPMDIVAVLTKVVQEQQKTIDELRNDIAELKKLDE